MTILSIDSSVLPSGITRLARITATVAALSIFAWCPSLMAQDADEGEATQVEKKADPQKGDQKKAGADKKEDAAKGGEKADPKKVKVGAEKKGAGQAGVNDPTKKKQQAPNPVQNLFNKLFQGAKNNPAPKVVNGDEVDEDIAAEASLDQIDRLAPVDRSQVTLLERAKRAAEVGSWTQMIGHLDRLFQKDQDSLVMKGNGTMVSIRHEAIRLLGSMPTEQKDLYIRQYSGAAKRLLAEAQADNDMGRLVEVATRYFWTESGMQAADLLATRHLDRAEYGMASIWLKQLFESKVPVTKTETWQRKAYFVFKMLENEEMIAAIEEEFSKPSIAEELLTNASSSIEPTEMDEWRYLHGNPRRHTVSTGSEPVLLKRWDLPTTWNLPLVEKLDQMISEFTDKKVATIPARYPLLVDGMVVARTFQGVQVADARTGQEIWSTEFNNSIEGALTGAQNNNPFGAMGNLKTFISQSSSSDQSGGPIGRLIFQNAANGMLSSDGKRVFIVEDSMNFQLAQSRVFGFNRNQDKNAFASNRLKAYDLKTGRPLWEAGGDDSVEELALPLRGSFFLGAPVLDGEDLLVVTEKDGEIRLQVLEPETGHPRWSQLLAYAESRINQDFRRRMWSTQVAVAGGTIICPTSVGWLVAVDRTRRSVLWAFRYTTRKKTATRTRRGFSSYMYVQPEPLNSRWSSSAPMIVGDKVLYSPAEKERDAQYGYSSTTTGGTLACVDLYTGKRIWQKPRGQGLYVAGVVDNRAIVVNNDSVEAIGMDDKKSVWKASLSPTDGQPSGRGVLLNGFLYQPTQRNKLLKIKLETGEIAARPQLTDDARPLGNLLMYDGMMVSFHPAAISAFEQQHAVDEKLARIAAGATDEESVVFQSEVLLAQNEFKKSIDLLLPLLENGAGRSPKSQTRLENTIRRAAIAQLSLSPSDQPELISLLERLARNAAHRLQNQQLKISGLIAGGKHVEAFTNLLAVSQQKQFHQVARIDQPKVETDFDNWIAGQLADVWNQLDDEGKKELGSSVQQRVAEVVESKNMESARRHAKLLAFHPSVAEICQSLSQAAIASNDSAEARFWVRRLQQVSNPDEQQDLVQLELDLALDAKDWIAAAAIVNRIKSQQLDSSVDEDVETRVAALKPKARPQWGEFDLDLKRSASNYSYRPAKLLETVSMGDSFLDDLRMEYGRQGYSTSSTARINFVREADNKLYWSVPLRSGRTSRAIFDIQIHGGLVVILNRGVLNCLSVADRKVLWTINVGETGLNVSTSHYQIDPMQLGSQFATHHSHHRAAQSGPIPVLNSEYVCFRSRRSIICLSTKTGEVRWTCSRVPDSSKIYGCKSAVFVVGTNGEDNMTLRASDGRQLKDHPGSSLFDSHVVQSTGEQVIRCVRKASDTNTLAIVSIDPNSGHFNWREEFPSRSYFKKVTEQEIGVLSTDGILSLLNVESGKRIDFEQIPAKDRMGVSQRHVVVDQNRVYVILNKRGNSYSYYGEMRFMGVNGLMAGFDRKSKKILWTKPVEKQNLLMSQIRRSPVFLFSYQQYDSKISTQRINLLALDKVSGRELIRSTTYSYSSMRSMHVDLHAKYIDLATYNERMRFNVVARRPDAPKSETNQQEAKQKTDTGKTAEPKKPAPNFFQRLFPDLKLPKENKAKPVPLPAAQQKAAAKQEAIKAAVQKAAQLKAKALKSKPKLPTSKPAPATDVRQPAAAATSDPVPAATRK